MTTITTTTTTTTAHDLFQQSHTAAEHIVKKWIRRTFAETSLQILRQQWNAQDENKTTTLEISSIMLQHCHRVCQRLAVHWETCLRKAGQEQVATWVHETAAVGQFWQEEEATASTIESNQEEEGDDTTPTNEDERRDSTAEPSTEAPSEEYKESLAEMQLPLAKLRHLYRDTAKDLNSCNATLDQLSQSHDNHCWPLDWNSTVQDYCQHHLISRLHTKRNQRVQYEVVPKEVLEQEEEEQEAACSATDLLGSQRMKLLLARKRKAADTDGQPQQEEQLPGRRMRKRTREDFSLLAPEARPPSDHPAQVIWDWQAEKKTLEHEMEHLEATMMHSDTDPDPPNTLLGALRSVGETHFYLSPHDATWNDKQRRRAKHAATKQRLQGDSILKLRNGKKSMTKVVKSTIGEKHQHYLELDVGQCILELDNGKLHAFSSLEISLLDEDVTPTT